MQTGCRWANSSCTHDVDVVVELVEGLLQGRGIADSRPHLNQFACGRVYVVAVTRNVGKVWVSEGKAGAAKDPR